MAYPTPKAFSADLKSRGEKKLLDLILTTPPFVFQKNPGDYSTFKGHFARQLGIPVDDIEIVGSARLGYSLAPDRFGTPFGPNSDIDVVIVCDRLFSLGWDDLLKWNHSRLWSMPKWRVDQILNSHQRSVFWGHIWPDMLTAMSGAGKLWATAVRALGTIPALAGIEVNGRIYKSWVHAKYYHLDSLRQLRASN